MIPLVGCKIKKIGNRGLNISGAVELKSTAHNVIFDRIETGTYLVATAITGGKILLKNTSENLLESVLSKLKEAGAEIAGRPGAQGVGGFRSSSRRGRPPRGRSRAVGCRRSRAVGSRARARAAPCRAPTAYT